MTHSIQIELQCDKCHTILETQALTIADARAEARDDGWAFSRNKDICCNCRQRRPKGLNKETWLEWRPDLVKGDDQ